MRCHGMGAKSSGLYPDLRHSTRSVHDQWNEIVLGGVRSSGGMASFADMVSAGESRKIQTYVIERALHEPSAVERLASWAAERLCVPVEWLTD